MDLCAHNYVHLKSLEEPQMIEDPIVEEVRNYRLEHAAKYGNNLERIILDFRKKEHESKRKVLNPGPKILLRKTGS